MAVGREIRNQISSVKNILKITRAMELVAASKMRKTQALMRASRPYAEKIRQVIGHVANSSSEYNHPYLQQPTNIKRVGYIVVSSDKGLCGSLNVNLFKAVLMDMKKWHEKGVEIDLCTIGRKAQSYFNRLGSNIVAQASHLGDKPEVADLIGIVKVMLDQFNEGQLDSIFLSYNQFINTMTQKVQINTLLPLEVSEDESKDHRWDYIYEPDAKELLTDLLVRYVESQTYQGVVEI